MKKGSRQGGSEKHIVQIRLEPTSRKERRRWRVRSSVGTGKAEMLKLKETMLLQTPERKVWSQPQNHLKDKQLFEAKRVARSEEVTQRYHLQEQPHKNDMFSVRDADVKTKQNQRNDSTSFQQS